MGERKVLNKYFPPDFDPADVPRGSRPKDNSMKVRMMLPMTVRCQTCGEFMYKGTKFNCKKEDVVGETYLGMQIFRFYMRCRKCSAEITYKTDPQHLDYTVEHGATRNFEQWKQEQTVEEALKARRAAEDEDRVKALENKTTDAKREMDMQEALDDMLHIKGQHGTITTEQALDALRAAGGDTGPLTADLTDADEAALRRLVEGGAFRDGLGSGSDGEEAAGAAPPAVRNLAGARPAVRRAVGVKVRPAVKRKEPDSVLPGQAGAVGKKAAVASPPMSSTSVGIGLGLGAYGTESDSG